MPRQYSEGSNKGLNGEGAEAGSSARMNSPRTTVRSQDDIVAAREGSMGRTNSDSEGTPTPGPPGSEHLMLGRGQWDVQSPGIVGDYSPEAAGGPGQGDARATRSTPSTLYSKRSLVPQVAAGRRRMDDVSAAASRAPPPYIPKLPLTGSAWQQQQQNQHPPVTRESPRETGPLVSGSARRQQSPRGAARPSQLATHLRDIHSNLQSNINHVVRPRAFDGSSPRSPPGLPISPRAVASISSPATGKVGVHVHCLPCLVSLKHCSYMCRAKLRQGHRTACSCAGRHAPAKKETEQWLASPAACSCLTMRLDLSSLPCRISLLPLRFLLICAGCPPSPSPFPPSPSPFPRGHRARMSHGLGLGHISIASRIG